MSRIIQTLRASARRNSPHSTTALPFSSKTVLNSFRPMTNTLTKPNRFSISTSARGRAKRHANPTRNGTRRMEVSSMASPLQFFELAHVHGRKGLANAKNEDAQDHDRDNHIEENPNLHHQRHPVGG